MGDFANKRSVFQQAATKIKVEEARETNYEFLIMLETLCHNVSFIALNILSSGLVWLALSGK